MYEVWCWFQGNLMLVVYFWLPIYLPIYWFEGRYVCNWGAPRIGWSGWYGVGVRVEGWCVCGIRFGL